MVVTSADRAVALDVDTLRWRAVLSAKRPPQISRASHNVSACSAPGARSFSTLAVGPTLCAVSDCDRMPDARYLKFHPHVEFNPPWCVTMMISPRILGLTSPHSRDGPWNSSRCRCKTRSKPHVFPTHHPPTSLPPSSMRTGATEGLQSDCRAVPHCLPIEPTPNKHSLCTHPLNQGAAVVAPSNNQGRSKTKK